MLPERFFGEGVAGAVACDELRCAPLAARGIDTSLKSGTSIKEDDDSADRKSGKNPLRTGALGFACPLRLPYASSRDQERGLKPGREHPQVPARTAQGRGRKR